MAGLKDEWGDLLFQSCSCRMARTGCSASPISRRLGRKRSGAIHVFADAASVANAADQVVNWER